MASAAVQAVASAAVSVGARRNPAPWGRGRALAAGHGGAECAHSFNAFLKAPSGRVPLDARTKRISPTARVAAASEGAAARIASVGYFTKAAVSAVSRWPVHVLSCSGQSRTVATESYGVRPDLYADDFFTPIDQDPLSRESQPRRYRQPIQSLDIPPAATSTSASSSLPSAPVASSSSVASPSQVGAAASAAQLASAALPADAVAPAPPAGSAEPTTGLPVAPTAIAKGSHISVGRVGDTVTASSAAVHPADHESYGRRPDLYDDMFIPIDEEQSRATRRYRQPVMQRAEAVWSPSTSSLSMLHGASRGFSTTSAASVPGRHEPPPGPPLLQSLEPCSASHLQSAVGQASVASFQKNLYKEHADVAAMSPVQCQDLLKKHSAVIEGPEPHLRPLSRFHHAGLPEAVLQKISEAGFTDPTSIQAVGWPIALAGHDMIGLAQTGSGKTLAYLLPALVHIAAQPPLQMGDGPVALVLAPTRELAMQIQLEAMHFGEVMGIRETVVFGGVPRQGQAQELRRGVELCVATPGRLLDFLESGVTNLKRVTYMVLDEADRMMDMGFEPQLRRIASQVRKDRQTLMWSATWPPEVQRLARDFCWEDPIKVTIGRVEEQVANPNIIQKVFVMSEIHKRQRFFEWLQETCPAWEQQPKILIFTETKAAADGLGRVLKQERFTVAALHGDKEQRERDRIMQGFRSGRTNILVATDVAQRGLDIRDIAFVVNYDTPKTVEDYIHRIGRTARAGALGTAVTFFSVDRPTSERVRLARGIARVMEEACQDVPEDLRRIANRPV